MVHLGDDGTRDVDGQQEKARREAALKAEREAQVGGWVGTEQERMRAGARVAVAETGVLYCPQAAREAAAKREAEEAARREAEVRERTDGLAGPA